jgi:hypothetical protein
MGHLHVLFELLRATRLFVVVGGQLRGVITRDRLHDALAATLPANVSVLEAAFTVLAAALRSACVCKFAAYMQPAYTARLCGAVRYVQALHVVLTILR